VVARANGFCPFFYVRVPIGSNPKESSQVLKYLMDGRVRPVIPSYLQRRGNDEDIEKFMEEYKEKLSKAARLQQTRSGIKRFIPRRLEELYWFQDGNKYTYLKIEFHTKAAFFALRNLLLDSRSNSIAFTSKTGNPILGRSEWSFDV